MRRRVRDLADERAGLRVLEVLAGLQVDDVGRAEPDLADVEPADEQGKEYGDRGDVAHLADEPGEVLELLLQRGGRLRDRQLPLDAVLGGAV